MNVAYKRIPIPQSERNRYKLSAKSKRIFGQKFFSAGVEDYGIGWLIIIGYYHSG